MPRDDRDDDGDDDDDDDENDGGDKYDCELSSHSRLSVP